MGIPFLPIVGTISNLATTAWDSYQKSKQVQQVLRANVENKAAQDALALRLDEVEATSLQQARLLSELSKDLEQFARATQTQLEEAHQRAKRTQFLLTLAIVVALASVGLSIYVLVR
jgi:hypothetical protein